MMFAKRLGIVACLMGLMAMLGGCNAPPPGPPVSESDFETEISSGELVLVKFGAEWCGPCKMVDKELEKISEGGALAVKIIEVDVDSNEALAQKYQVGGIPHMILVRDNEVLDQQVGYMTAEELETWIQAHLGTADSQEAT
jgi:thioredoxin 1